MTKRRFKRTWYAILGLIWLGVMGRAAMSGPVALGESLVHMLLFTLAWQIVGYILSKTPLVRDPP